MAALFELDNFSVHLETESGPVTIVDSVSLSVARGETLCIVGESGSGKSVMVLSAVRLMEFSAPISLTGRAVFDGEDLVLATPRRMARIRGARIGVVFQEAMEALNPTQTIGAQLLEAFVSRDVATSDRPVDGPTLDARTTALALLDEVGLLDGPGLMKKYPHQLSGGMQQRVMIAMALMGDPELLIADEPTTALDVTIQAEILDLLRRLQRERNMACILITHDMGVASEVADRIAVVYAGQVVEIGPISQMLASPQHAYTKALLECVPRPQQRLVGRMRTIPGSVPAPGTAIAGDRFAPRNALATDRCLTEAPPVHTSVDGLHMVRSWSPVLEWTNELVDVLTGHATDGASLDRSIVTDTPVIEMVGVNKTYNASARKLGVSAVEGTRAVRDLNLTVNRGEFFGIVGETGSGKSTLGRLMLDLETADEGSLITVAGHQLATRRAHGTERALRKQIQMVFQNPQDSLDPRHSIGRAIAEPLKALTDLNRVQREARVFEMLDAVGLPRSSASKYPTELSGGMRQRVALARAIAPRPSVIVADEPTSALDVSVQGQIINLMLDLQVEFGLTYIFITHNLSLITAVADRVGVMYRGELVEVGPATEIMFSPQHDYTARLLAANPDPFSAIAR